MLQKAQRGELDVQQAVFIDPEVLVPNSPVTAPQAGKTVPLAQLCAAALQNSDNTAANLLLQPIGHHRIRSLYRLRDTGTPRALGGGIQICSLERFSVNHSVVNWRTGCAATRPRPSV